MGDAGADGGVESDGVFVSGNGFVKESAVTQNLNRTCECLRILSRRLRREARRVMACAAWPKST